MFKKFRGMFSNDLSIDLGTANTLIYVRGSMDRSLENMPRNFLNIGAGGPLEKGPIWPVSVAGRMPGALAPTRPRR